MRRFTFGLLAVLALAAPAAAQGTLTPWPKPQFTDSNNNPVSGGKLCVYIAGTTTPTNTYSDVTLSTPNQNPITLDAAGRPPSGAIYLASTTSYKYVLLTAGTDGTCSTGSTVWTQDNIPPIPINHADSDITGTAGENLTAGQVVYLSDGSGGKTSGRWYRADSTNTYSSTLPEIGMVPASITSGNLGTIRLLGSMTGLSSLTVGTKYYVSTTGSLTSTAPSNSRVVGSADSTTSLVLKDIPLASFTSPVINTSIVSNVLFAGTCQCRLTLSTGVPVTTADVTAATTLRLAPYLGSLLALYDGSANWTLLTFNELSIAVPATTSQMYDVFVFNNSGTPTLELLAWTNDTTRATALTTQNGALVKTGATTRLYVGSFRTTTVSGQTEDSLSKRYVWNNYNRARRALQRFETTATWTYGSATLHQANAAAANQVEAVIGVLENPVQLVVRATFQNPTATNVPLVAIGLDSTSAMAGNQAVWGSFSTGNNGGVSGADYLGFPSAVGRHTYVWLEGVVNSGSAVNFYSNTNSVGGATTASSVQSGITGWIEG